MSFLTIKNIVKSFPRKNTSSLTVLKDINFEINKNEFVSIIGPSGCGKSTLLNILAGLEKPDKGEVLLNGNKVNNPGKERVMVFQESSLFPWLSVIENVMFGLKNNNVNKDKAYNIALEQLKNVHLEEFIDSYPHQLSGGMKQRVALARALVLNPKTLLMDEPFGALDEQTRLMLHQELMKIWMKTKKTIVFVTHNIREAVKLSDRVIVLGTEPGRIIDKFKINLPRPRSLKSERLIKLENQVFEVLQSEIKNNMAEGDQLYETISA